MGIGFGIETQDMKILVTGATGFIGNHVINTLLADGHAVIASSRSLGKAKQQPWYSRVKYLPLNISGEEANVFERSDQPDLLIHLAWQKLDSYRDPAHFETIVHEHYHFIRNLVLAGLQRCLVTGTCLEYGMQSGQLKEDMEARPSLAYPLGKHLLRLMLEGLQLSQTFKLQWLRLFYLYGMGQRANSLLAQLDIAIAEGKSTFDMSKGDQVRDYLPVTEVARIISRIATVSDFNGILNCCSGQGIAVRELVANHLYIRSAQLNLNLGKYPYPDYEPFAFWGDRTKLNKLLEHS